MRNVFLCSSNVYLYIYGIALHLFPVQVEKALGRALEDDEVEVQVEQE